MNNHFEVKKKLDLMVDIETLGNTWDSTIFQIAFQGFSIEDRTIYKDICFNKTMDFNSGISVNAQASTIGFWLKNNDVFSSIIDNAEKGLTEHQLYKDAHEFLTELSKEYDLTLWGNGISYDNTMLKSKFIELSLDYPIKYYNDRDLRTLLEIGATLIGLNNREYVKRTDAMFNNMHHNAIEDCLSQIKKVFFTYDIIENENMRDSKIEETSINFEII